MSTVNFAKMILTYMTIAHFACNIKKWLQINVSIEDAKNVI